MTNCINTTTFMISIDLSLFSIIVNTLIVNIVRKFSVTQIALVITIFVRGLQN